MSKTVEITVKFEDGSVALFKNIPVEDSYGVGTHLLNLGYQPDMFTPDGGNL